MSDMRQVIIPKSDQINADDLIGGPITITITQVAIRAGTEQPVSVFYEGDGGKPWKPCKSMSRVLVTCWGPDANKYVGQSLTLFRDPGVKWGGMLVGGIRISHMTGIKGRQTIPLTETKGKRTPFVVDPLKAPEPKGAPPAAVADPPKRTAKMFLDDLESMIKEALESVDAIAEVRAILDSPDVKRAETVMSNGHKIRLDTIIQNALAAIAQPAETDSDEDGFPGDAP